MQIKSYKKTISLSILFIFSLVALAPSSVLASHRTSGLRSKINDLDNDRVDDLPVPILFGVTPQNLWSNFGEPRGLEGERTHEGLDIMAPKGAPVASPTEAVVTRIGEGDNAGLYVYTANPGGESMAYMHLDKIADIDVGDVLGAGDIIGYVGNTGNAKLTPPHLHYELHDDDGDPIDPFPRLNRIFPLKDKIDAITKAIGDGEDSDVFINFIVANYKSDFLLARSVGMPLPPLIDAALVHVTSVVTPLLGYAPDMNVGSKGPYVAALQTYLMTKRIGSGAGLIADGNFGPKTSQALLEFQRASGIVGEAGFFGPITRAFMIAHP